MPYNYPKPATKKRLNDIEFVREYLGISHHAKPGYTKSRIDRDLKPALIYRLNLRRKIAFKSTQKSIRN